MCQEFADIVKLAAFVCETPYATLSMAGRDVTWCRSTTLMRSAACASLHTFGQIAARSGQLLEVPDVASDARFDKINASVDGKPVAFYAGVPMMSADGQVLGTLAVLDFVARRLNADQRDALLGAARQVATWLALREHFLFARSLVEDSPAAIYHVDARGHITHGNPAYRRICGLTAGDSLEDWVQGVHPDDRSQLETAWADFCANPRSVVFEWRGVPQAGVSRVYTEHVVAAHSIAGFVGTITDITEHAEARASLQRAEMLFQNTFEQAPIGIIYVDKQGRVLRGNKAFCEMLGIDSRQIESLSIGAFTHDDDVARNAAEFERLWRGDINAFDMEKRYLDQHRRPVWVRATCSLVRNAHGKAICAVEFLRDISARKNLAAALLQNQRLLKAVIADVPFAIRACDLDGRVFLHNPAAAELFAIGPADPLRPQARTGVRAAIEVFLPDGKTPVPEQERPLARALRGETVMDVELVIARPGDTVRITLNSARRLADQDGAVLGAVAVTQDVSGQRMLERDLAHAQKLESIGQLAAGIAHEINTPTQYIGDNIRFLQESFGDILTAAAPDAAAIDGSDLAYLQTEIPRAILQSLDGVERIAKIVGAMKEFSHPATERTPLDLNHAIANTITVASNEWKYVASIGTEFDSQLPLVPVMPGAFNQVILNMIVNAAHAIDAAATAENPAKGKITITTRCIDGWAEIGITDTGCGMPADVIPRIFDPFFTTKPVGKGTGQGLAIAHDVVVTKHGGTITVDSRPGAGTTFTLRLPLGTA